MLLRLYALRDVKMGGYNQPFSFPNDAVCGRAVKDMLNESGSQIGAHAEDYQLFFIGTFETDSGMIFSLSGPEMIAECAALKGGV